MSQGSRTFTVGLFLLTWSLPALVGALQGALGNLVPASGERNLGLPLHKRSLQITRRGEAFFLLAGQKVTRHFVGDPFLIRWCCLLMLVVIW